MQEARGKRLMQEARGKRQDARGKRQRDKCKRQETNARGKRQETNARGKVDPQGWLRAPYSPGPNSQANDFFSLIVTFVLGAEIISGGQPARTAGGRRLGPQVAVLEGGAQAAGRRRRRRRRRRHGRKSRTFTRGEEKQTNPDFKILFDNNINATIWARPPAVPMELPMVWREAAHVQKQHMYISREQR